MASPIVVAPPISAHDLGWPAPIPVFKDSNISGARNNRADYNRPMAERWVPKALSRPDWAVEGKETDAVLVNRAHLLYDLVQWLDFTHSLRWLKNEQGGTYCDHGALDLWGQWLSLGDFGHPLAVPPLAAGHWWKADVETKIRNGVLAWHQNADGGWVFGKSASDPLVANSSTAKENGATALFRWFRDWGEQYGWAKIADEESLNAVMDMHQCPGIIICEKKPSGGASHVCTSLPASLVNVARVRGGVIQEKGQSPVLSTEAGGRSRTLTQRRWWEAPVDPNKPPPRKRWNDQLFLFYRYSPDGECLDIPAKYLADR